MHTLGLQHEVIGEETVDGFYGEPAPFDPSLEVEIELVTLAPVVALPQAAQVIALRNGEHLDDDWFGSFDETKEIDAVEHFDDVPTTRWQRIGGWLRAIGRAA